MFDAETSRRERDLDIAYFTAWRSGFFSQPWGKNFPRYDKHAPKRARKKTAPQTWQQQKMIAQALNAAFGGTFEKRQN